MSRPKSQHIMALKQNFETLNPLKETPSVQSLGPILAALCSEEIEESTAETMRLRCNELNDETDDPKHHCTDRKVSLVFAETPELLTEHTDHCGNNARALTLAEKVINRWTGCSTSSSHHRNADQSKRAGTGSEPLEARTALLQQSKTTPL